MIVVGLGAITIHMARLCFKLCACKCKTELRLCNLTTGHKCAVRCGQGPTETVTEDVSTYYYATKKRMPGRGIAYRLIRSSTVSLLDSKWTIFSRPCNHANFLATEFYTIHQLHHPGLPFLQTNIVE